jgi:transcriptional regulator with XRE-family HTH domain
MPMMITRLEIERRRRELTQLALAQFVHCDPSFISHLQRGYRPPATSPIVRRLERFFGMPIDELLARLPVPETNGHVLNREREAARR